jgi:membrane protease YdiL (CAAX protease family)
MAVIPVTVTKRVDVARVVRLAELAVIPLTNNLVAFVTWRTGLDLYPVLAALLYIYVTARHFGARGEPFRWSWRSVRLAVVAGLGLGLPPLLFFVHPILVSQLQYGHVSAASVSLVNNLLWRVLVDIPVMTAIVEELVFRSYLFVIASTTRRTILINSGVFLAWHLVAAFTTVQSTAFGHAPILFLTSYLGALAAILVAGVVFIIVRLKTGSFVYSALAHWLTDSVMIVALFGVAHLGW